MPTDFKLPHVFLNDSLGRLFSPAGIRLLDVLLAVAAITATKSVRTSTAAWRGWVMTFCIAFIASRSCSSFFFGESAGLLAAALLVLTAAVGLLVPWSARWQIALAVLTLLSLTVYSQLGARGP